MNKKYQFSENHTWICPETGRVGISDFAQSELGEVVFLDLLPSGTEVKQSGKIGDVESTKIVLDILSPVDGEIKEVNEQVMDQPELLNEDPYGKGWLIKMSPADPGVLSKLMTYKQYGEFVAK